MVGLYNSHAISETIQPVNPESLLQTVVVYAIPVLFAITVHEVAHGYIAKLCGDDTAWKFGRLTLNPLKHIDLFGTVILPLLLLLTSDGKFVFGYAKPVPVNFGNLRRPRTQQFWVLLAGPFSNFLQALGWALIFLLLAVAGIEERFFVEMARAGIIVNLVMWALNLFPMPPLDGGRVLTGLLPYRQAQAFGRIEPFGFVIVLALLWFQLIDRYWLDPLVGAALKVINTLFALFQ
jgi:Zn-dependent protease